MSEMIERVVAALIEEAPEVKTWVRACQLGLVRAAIEAMRIPTVEMLNAGDQLLDDTVECAHNVWNAMIDEALK